MSTVRWAGPIVQLGRKRPGGSATPTATAASRHARGGGFLLEEFPLPLEQTTNPRRAPVATGPDGRFAMADTPLAAGVNLMFSRIGFQPRRVPSMQAASGFLDVTLQREVGEGEVTGVVLDAVGRPVEGADLRFGYQQRTKSSATGAFTFELEKRPARLVATRPGFLPILHEAVGKDTPTPLVLTFSKPALDITGRVVDGNGAPMAGMLVDLVDPQRGGWGELLERLSAPVQDLPKGALARCDADGRFVLSGLCDRSYRLRAYDPKTALSVQSEPVPAGSRDVVLTVPADAFLDELRGIVVLRDGRGVAGASIGSYLLADTALGTDTVPGPLATTDADGRFVLRKVPRRHLTLGVQGDDLVYTTVTVEECQQQGEVRIEVLRRCYVQVEGEVGLTVTFFNGSGKRLDMIIDSVGGSFSSTAWKLRQAKSPVLTLPESAVVMAWSKADKEIGRRAIVLEPSGKRVTALVAGL